MPPTTEKHINISAQQAQKLKESGQCLILDVRRADERQIKSIPDSIHLPSEEVTAETLKSNGFDESKKHNLIITHCNRGGRGSRIRNLMEEMGFTNVKNLEGGIVAWEEAQLPVTQSDVANPIPVKTSCEWKPGQSRKTS